MLFRNPPIMKAPVLAISTAVASLAGFLFGYDNIVISGAIGYLSIHYALSPAGIGWAAGCALIGCLLGSATAGSIADSLGLRKALYGCAACFALSALGVWTANSFAGFVAWRILGGVGIGAASIVAPMYIAEIAPAKLRGRLVVFYQLGIVFGILAAVYVNMLIRNAGSDSWNAEHGWRWMFAAAGLPAIVLGCNLIFSMESPRWLMKHGHEWQALQVLSAIKGAEAGAAEVAVIHESLQGERGGLKELFSRSLRPALAMGSILAAFSQLSGITALLSFLPQVFLSAGQQGSSAFQQSVLVGIVNLICTGLAIWLVDRKGRRTLLLAGTGLQTAALASVGTLYLLHGNYLAILASIMLFVSGHAIGNGAVCWVIISEIFPTKIRGAAMSIATTAIWISAYLANQFFPLMQKYLGIHGLFFFFAVMALLNFIYILAVVPETKGCSLEQIAAIWSRPQKI
jgi:SP family arabinose:H+ symporter-like MFS transporter